MTQRDQWSEKLRCPNCSAAGSVRLSQANPASAAYHDGDENVRVEFTPAGFNAEVSDMGCRFFCANCGALAHHTNLAASGLF
jgi:hypothetical protein